MNGVEETVRLSLDSEDCNTRACFVKDLDAAKAAAAALAEEGIDFIELCSWFDQEKTEAIIEAAGGKIPVGSCGLAV